MLLTTRLFVSVIEPLCFFKEYPFRCVILLFISWNFPACVLIDLKTLFHFLIKLAVSYGMEMVNYSMVAEIKRF